ncbi:MAG: hypothetical protein IPJ98_20940 [Bryobacterales bacterium]|nr:hypothetical protein [Bryobacterales bacterium]
MLSRGREMKRRFQELFPLLYGKLRRHSAKLFESGECTGHTLQSTAALHEAYLRLLGQHEVD